MQFYTESVVMRLLASMPSSFAPVILLSGNGILRRPKAYLIALRSSPGPASRVSVAQPNVNRTGLLGHVDLYCLSQIGRQLVRLETVRMRRTILW
jgi:hypothetical protein